MRPAILLSALVFLAAPAQAQTLTDESARAFVARQERAWNDRELDRYFDGFTPDATFTDQAYVGDKPPVPYGSSSVTEARALARRAAARSRQAQEVLRVEIAPDGRSARVVSRVGSTVTAGGKTRRLCASRVQVLIAAGGRLRAASQTDTYVKCRT